MDVEDRQRYFIVGSVILEIVQPLFRTRLENDYQSKGIGSLQAFLNTLPVIHILFHLRHRNAFCCKDNLNCRNNSKLPLIYCQWDLLYTENSGQPGHNCYCKFIANPVQLNELDITLTSLILLNCCHLGPSEENAVRKLRRYKNDYLSHNTEGKINETEYKSLWTDLINCVLQLDPNKQDELIRIQNRPLDEGLCSRYSTYLLNVHKKLNEIDTRIQGIDSAVQELLSYHRKEAICQYCKEFIGQGMNERKINPYKLGQDIFYVHHQVYLKPVLNKYSSLEGEILDVVMMDDGRLVMCLYNQCRLLICNTDGSKAVTISVDGKPYCVIPVNNSTVAVTVIKTCVHPSLKIYDINNEHELNSIPVPGMTITCGIAMINNKLVIGADRGLVIVDYQTGEKLKYIETNCVLSGIHTSGGRIFFGHYKQNILCWYSFANVHTIRLPSKPRSMTTLQDGSLYVLCTDGSVQHVSTDVKQFKTLNINQSKFCNEIPFIRYNSKQKKGVTLSVKTGNIKILYEV
ncbi:Hypothetical predicted protein [Mytilus galloprovincialis]|uniref:DZIP3-like HEPN domain-containing protein n=1 Tax=Mytilus galloprovincialis TaxID=29158 RepID=A0A8B6F1W4_MYTGA|nr:Hypothetical predicted protein [Mytilus galloprovincialis]